MEAMDCAHSFDVEPTANLSVGEVMRAEPKVLSGDASVGDLRRMFANPHVASALLADGPRLVGLIDRDDLGDQPEEAPTRPLARADGLTIRAEATVAEALARLDEAGGSRLVVVGPDGTTVQGLLCLNARRTGFCR